MKAQISIDFIITLSLLMILFVFVLQVSLDRQDFDQEMVYRIQAQSKANTLARLINAVHQGGEGAFIEHDFLQQLRNARPYNMTINERARRVEVRWANQIYETPIQTANVTAGEVNGTVTVSNSGGVINVA